MTDLAVGLVENQGETYPKSCNVNFCFCHCDPTDSRSMVFANSAWLLSEGTDNLPRELRSYKNQNVRLQKLVNFVLFVFFFSVLLMIAY